MREEISLRFVGPTASPPDGQSAITVDLSGFSLLVGRVGRDAALLFLLLRAVRVRSLQASLHSLAWPLRTTEARVAAWLDALARADLVVYATERTGPREVLVFEFPAQSPLTVPERVWPASPVRQHTLPTIWFAQTLPLLGRDAFALYLALLGHEPLRRPTAEISWPATAQAIGIRGAWRQRRAIRRLLRTGILTLDGARGTLGEPRPPTAHERRVLRFLAIPSLPAILRHIALLALLLVLALAALLTLGLDASRHR